MVFFKNRIISFLLIIASIILIDLIFFKIAMPADNTQIILDENLKPGMPLKDAIELVGSPERITISNTHTIVLPYDTLGLSLEVINGGTVIEVIHVQPSFKGRFASGIEIGADFQNILSAYNQPDMMTKEVIEYSDLARRFQINEGKLTGAVLYSAASELYSEVKSKEPVKYIAAEEVPEEIHKDVRETLREELREEVLEEVREEVLEEVNKEIDEDFDVFGLFGLKVKYTSRGVIITEITPGSVAEKGDLKIGEPVRKVFYEGGQKLSIYTVSGLEKILNRSVVKRKKIINILQDKNYYYKVEVPQRK